MPLNTATPARIRRVIREAEYARSSNGAVLVARPSAQDGFANVREGFFDVVGDAQILLDELAAVVMVDRIREAVETDTPFQLGTTIALTPAIPRARLIDTTNGIDKTGLIKGVAIDLGADRNSIEVLA